MQINNVTLFNEITVSIGITEGKITSVSRLVNNNADPFKLQFDNAIAFPGLINSHDHLEFNLFPQLGDQAYTNYTQWGEHIHKNYKEDIDKVLKIPETLRTSWGIYKNLLCGVTTVVNHGKNLEILNPLITVIQELQSLHSVKFEKYWKLKLNDPFKKKLPCVIHAGEGIDSTAQKEIDEIVKWNFLNRDLVAIHGVAMNPKQAIGFKALVWCPASNYFLLNKTAAVKQLKKNTKICLGTDSTLTANWNIWEHVRVAKESDAGNGLFEMITSTPAKVWNLNSGFIAEGKDADIVIAKASDNFNRSFYCIDPEDILLVIHNGNIRMFDEQLFPQLEAANFNFIHFFKIEINKVTKYVEGNLPKLISLIKRYYPEAVLPIDISH